MLKAHSVDSHLELSYPMQTLPYHNWKLRFFHLTESSILFKKMIYKFTTNKGIRDLYIHPNLHIRHKKIKKIFAKYRVFDIMLDKQLQ